MMLSGSLVCLFQGGGEVSSWVDHLFGKMLVCYMNDKFCLG